LVNFLFYGTELQSITGHEALSPEVKQAIAKDVLQETGFSLGKARQLYLGIPWEGINASIEPLFTLESMEQGPFVLNPLFSKIKYPITLHKWEKSTPTQSSPEACS
jgi:hypothetical protein